MQTPSAFWLATSSPVILTWAEAVNMFFGPTVHIQADRGHRVVDSGPYALVRHPGYAAAVFLVLGIRWRSGRTGR